MFSVRKFKSMMLIIPEKRQKFTLKVSNMKVDINHLNIYMDKVAYDRQNIKRVVINSKNSFSEIS